MCFSAQVKQNAKKLARQFGAAIDTDAYEQLLLRRLKGEKIAIGKGIEESFSNDPKGAQEKRIAKIIEKWHEARVIALDAEIEKQSVRLSCLFRDNPAILRQF